MIQQPYSSLTSYSYEEQLDRQIADAERAIREREKHVQELRARRAALRML